MNNREKTTFIIVSSLALVAIAYIYNQQPPATSSDGSPTTISAGIGQAIADLGGLLGLGGFAWLIAAAP